VSVTARAVSSTGTIPVQIELICMFITPYIMVTFDKSITRKP